MAGMGPERVSRVRGTPRRSPRRGARNIYLDALRAVALSRVVVYHVVSREWITLVSAMPLMFFIAGSLYAAALERRAARQVILDRYRRILLPYWLYVVAMVALWGALGVLGDMSLGDWVGMVMPVLAPEGPRGPEPGTLLEMTWIALWYLQFHLTLSLVGPWLRRVQQRHAARMWAVLGAAFLVGVAAGSGIVVVVFYVSCWILGYHQHDGDLAPLARRWWRPVCALAGPVGLGLFLAFEPASESSGVAARLAAVGAGLLGAFWLTLALALQARIEPYLRRGVTPAVVHWFSQRSLTIYMWHLVAIYAAIRLELPGATNWFGVLMWCAALTVVAVVVVGWAEDVAARRPVRLWPRPAIDLRPAT